MGVIVGTGNIQGEYERLFFLPNSQLVEIPLLLFVSWGRETVTDVVADFRALFALGIESVDNTGTAAIERRNCRLPISYSLYTARHHS